MKKIALLSMAALIGLASTANAELKISYNKTYLGAKNTPAQVATNKPVDNRTVEQKKELANVCVAIAKVSGRYMVLRQSNTTPEQANKINQDLIASINAKGDIPKPRLDMYTNILTGYKNAAYKVPVYEKQEQKVVAVQNFTRQNFATCLQQFGLTMQAK